ncbi:DUF6221 family protein [Streptomyces tendae]|uniref:DUF6221 family protein n=1 Tax=Streptomyces tendae TaxID=1932 RepID=UPI003D71EE26
MDDLVQFLRDRLDEDESIAREAAHYEAGHWTTKDGYPVSVADELPEAADTFERVVVFDEGSPSEEQAAHIARHDPARVLTEVESKRQIVNWVDRSRAFFRETNGTLTPAAYQVLGPLAAVYADHPDYNEAWRP